MMMRYAPFVVAFGSKHREPGRTGYRLAIDHSGKCVEPGDEDSFVIDLDGVAFVDRIFVAPSL
jgi:hypothetical protein